MLYLPCLHSIDYLWSQGKDALAVRPRPHVRSPSLRKVAQPLGVLYDGAEVVPLADVLDPIEGRDAGRVQPVLVAIWRDENAVGGDQDRPPELVELLLLFLPGRAVVADEVLVLLQLRIAIGRKHLTVGVDVDAGTLGLLQQLFQVEKVMPRDQYARPLDRSGPDLGGGRDAEMLGVSRIEHLHGLEVHHPGLHDGVPQVLHGEVHIGQGLEQGLLDERVDLRIGLAQHAGVMSIRSDSLEAVEQGVHQAVDVLILPAHTADGACHTLGGLLALVTVHGHFYTLKRILVKMIYNANHYSI